MQIRKRNGHIECLRAIWDKEKKRTVQKLIKVKEFTVEENSQYEDFMIQETMKNDILANQKAVVEMPSLLRKMIAGLAEGARPSEPYIIYDQITKLQKALKKAGISRPLKLAPGIVVNVPDVTHNKV